MAKIDARILRGFRDHLPDDMLARGGMLDRVEAAFRRFGFAPLATPALEYSEVLLGKYGDEGDKLLYRFADNGGRDVALRYDLTVPLARVVAMHGGLQLPFKRYQVASVWRAEKPGRGRFREFMQCDADIIGAAGPEAEVEILALGRAVMEAVGVADYRIRVNHRGVFDGLLDLLGVEESGRRAAVVRTLDKVEKIGRDAVIEVLGGQMGLGTEAVRRAALYLDLPPADLEGARRFFDGKGPGAAAVEALGGTLDLATACGEREGVEADLGIARGLDYYTGIIYETQLLALPGIGSVMSGGRYDGLMGMFGAPPHAAVGISLGVDRLLAALSELGVLGAGTVADVLVAAFGSEGFAGAYRLAGRLRKAGLAAEVHLLPRAKIGKQIRYADRRGIPFVLLQGPDELAAATVRLKDLRSGEEQTLTVEEAIRRLRAAGP